MWSPNVAGWERTERERLFTAIFAESCVASSEALLALLTTLHRRRPTEWAHAQRVAHMREAPQLLAQHAFLARASLQHHRRATVATVANRRWWPRNRR